ncbi:MAG: AbrB/MazE/SpoVT family DNA-binding domain-containing protein [Oscillospiraceae bacterium]|nr:AbrB/MazE/SpoVT family DNA-binding domain-containing protein [Oscillospiraceae bacterium]
MKATGIVRRIDDLGRVVIPKEIRRTLRIREGDPLEIYTEKDGEVIFKKYSPMGELSGFAGEICESLCKSTGSITAVCDRDSVIAVAGGGKRDLLDRPISRALEEIMENRRAVRTEPGPRQPHPVENETDLVVSVAAPILSEGDVLGCVMFLGHAGSPEGSELEFKLAQTVAGFLGRQMES